MATTQYVSTDEMTSWPSVSAYQAAGATDVCIHNPDFNYDLYFWIQTSATAPTFDPTKGILLRPGEKFYVTLADLEYVWVSAQVGKTANIVE